MPMEKMSSVLILLAVAAHDVAVRLSGCHFPGAHRQGAAWGNRVSVAVLLLRGAGSESVHTPALLITYPPDHRTPPIITGACSGSDRWYPRRSL